MCELLRSEPLRHPEVVPLVMVGLAADRPLESNFFPGLLEGLLGSLGIAALGEGNPPTSSREGAGRAWSTAVREAVSRIEQRDAETPEAVGLPPSLDLRYEETFLETQRHLIPPVFSDLLLSPKMAKAVFELAKPPVVSKVLPLAHRRVAPSTPPQPESGGLEQGVLKSEEPIPSTSQPTPQVQEQISEASNTDSDGADMPPPEKKPPRQSLKVRLPLKLLKRGHQTTARSSKDGVTLQSAEGARGRGGRGWHLDRTLGGSPPESLVQAVPKGSPGGPEGPCPDPRSPGGGSGHSTGSGLFPHFPSKAGSQRDSPTHCHR